MSNTPPVSEYQSIPLTAQNVIHKEEINAKVRSFGGGIVDASYSDSESDLSLVITHEEKFNVISEGNMNPSSYTINSYKSENSISFSETALYCTDHITCEELKPPMNIQQKNVIHEIMPRGLCSRNYLSESTSIHCLTSFQEKSISATESNDIIRKLPLEIIINHILSYLKVKDFLSMSSSSKYWRCLIFSIDTCHLWNDPRLFHGPLQICIDSYCPLCQLNKRYGSSEAAFSVLSKVPMKSIRMHCFVTDIPYCLEAVGSIGVIQRLDLQLTNRRDSPSLEKLLLCRPLLMNEYMRHNPFSELRELILESSHLKHINCTGREILLQILGRNLLSVKFIGLSPSKAFEIISKACPRITRIRVDKAISMKDMIDYRNADLDILEVLRTGFVLPSLHNLPSLKYLKYSASFRLQYNQIESMMTTISYSSVRYLHIEIPGSFVNETIVLVSLNLSQLETLVLEGNHDSGCIQSSSISVLAHHCRHIHRFAALSWRSVAMISFSNGAFMGLVNMLSLESLCVLYQDEISMMITSFLQLGGTVKELVVLCRRSWFDNPDYLQLQDIIRTTQEEFPRVNISLQELNGNHFEIIAQVL